jgi:hypothetical protein
MMAHTCNPCYTGGAGRRTMIQCHMVKSVRAYLKHNDSKKNLGVAQVKSITWLASSKPKTKACTRNAV